MARQNGSRVATRRGWGWPHPPEDQQSPRGGTWPWPPSALPFLVRFARAAAALSQGAGHGVWAPAPLGGMAIYKRCLARFPKRCGQMETAAGSIRADLGQNQGEGGVFLIILAYF